MRRSRGLGDVYKRQLLNRKYYVLDDNSNLYYAPGASWTASFTYKFF